jgi:predicted acetyltransferase
MVLIFLRCFCAIRVFAAGEREGSMIVFDDGRKIQIFEFKDFDYLTDGEIDLRIEEKVTSNEEKGYVPVYKYRITLHNSDNSIGAIDIRIGYNENLYYGGNIGYRIEKTYKGNNYALKACKIIKDIAIAHGMNRLIITCNPDNLPSRRTCEKAGLKLKEIVDLPIYNEMYQIGERQKCIYEWIL